MKCIFFSNLFAAVFAVSFHLKHYMQSFFLASISESHIAENMCLWSRCEHTLLEMTVLETGAKSSIIATGKEKEEGGSFPFVKSKTPDGRI